MSGWEAKNIAKSLATSNKVIHGYSSPVNVGDKRLNPREGPRLFDNQVYIQEKIDGSQFSFMKDGYGVVHFRSRKQTIYIESPGMFKAGVEAVLDVQEKLVEGSIYRGEYLSKPKHNTLCYDRTPKQYVVIYDIEESPTNFLGQVEVMHAAVSLGFDYAPVYYTGKVVGLEQLQEYLDNTSVLGGPVEGVVIKPVGMELFGLDNKIVMAKYVRPEFKEHHNKEWKKSNPTRKDVVQMLIEAYRTPQRWDKAIQHLREAGELEGTPRDIGKLFKEVPADVLKECGDEIKDALFKHFWKAISRGITAGLAEWYKNKLIEGEFGGPDDETNEN
jgi:hypothetical protein